MFANRPLYELVFICVTIYPLTRAEKPDDGCGRSILGTQSGFLSFNNYPGSYLNNSWCEWKIRVNASLRIILKFEDLSLEGADCETDYLKIIKEHHGSRDVYRQYCGKPKFGSEVITHPIYTDTSELTVSFRASSHSSGRGFRLSYDTVDYTDLLSCTNKGIHFSLSTYRKLCPAGCGAAVGDVTGDVSQGYRDTSVLCKAAVHAGIILDGFGGPITVGKHRGIRYYEPVRANGILSRQGSLSEALFTFATSDCSRQSILQPSSITSSWDRARSDGSQSVSPTGPSESDPKHWLQLDLGEKRKITGILTRASFSSSGAFVQSFKILYKEKSRWRSYNRNNSTEDTVFEGNEDTLYLTRNTFRPSFSARYVRVVPLAWQQGISVAAELLGCSYLRISPVNVTVRVPRGPVHIEPGLNEEEITEPVPSQADLVKLVIIVVSAVVCVALLLLLSICIFKVLQQKKKQQDVYNSTDPPQTGCWKQVKHPSPRHQSTEFTFSYSSEKDPLPKMDLVTSNMADYQQPLMLGVGTVSRKGSTFRPMDTDSKDDQADPSSHYDHLHTANQYALPLTNQEPEYATPIIERHVFRTDGFLPDPSYSVPGAVPSKSASFKAADSNYRAMPGGYQTPQTKRNRAKGPDGARSDRLNHSDGVYDSPKCARPAVPQNGNGSEYQRPQAKGYAAPRDCVRLEPEGCAGT